MEQKSHICNALLFEIKLLDGLMSRYTSVQRSFKSALHMSLQQMTGSDGMLNKFTGFNKL